MGELVRTSTVDQAAEHLRSGILEGRIRPGTPLREASLAERLGVSRNTLRESLIRLEHEALVRHEVHRGAVVATPGPSDVDDICLVRKLLECEGLSRIAEGSPRSLAPIREAVRALEARAEAGDWEGYAEAEARFHGLLVDAIGSARLSALHRRCLGELRLALIAVDRALDPGTPRRYVKEHRRILQQVASGRLEDARRLLVRHLDEAAALVKEMAAGA